MSSLRTPLSLALTLAVFGACEPPAAPSASPPALFVARFAFDPIDARTALGCSAGDPRACMHLASGLLPAASATAQAASADVDCSYGLPGACGAAPLADLTAPQREDLRLARELLRRACYLPPSASAEGAFTPREEQAGACQQLAAIDGGPCALLHHRAHQARACELDPRHCLSAATIEHLYQTAATNARCREWLSERTAARGRPVPEWVLSGRRLPSGEATP